MFTDRVNVQLIAGKGGNGIVAWRREKYLPKGGPYGGNGGRGGNVILETDENLNSLEVYRHKRILRSENGREGGTNLRQGKSGTHLTIKVPFGTLVKDRETGEILHDFTPETPKWTACTGGKGGKGNNFFKSSTNRAPNKFTLGTEGEELQVELELKLIADVGLVGMPNAGKSTLMTEMTHARVKIGAYPFTTLSPNLSYVQCEDYTRILIADIPGIIANAHLDKGLGLQFLKHIERTSTLVFVLDALPYEEDRNAIEDFAILRKELEEYSSSMLEKKFLVALNKSDKDGADEAIAAFKEAYPFDPSTLFVISAKEGEGLAPLIETMRLLTLQKKTGSKYEAACNH